MQIVSVTAFTPITAAAATLTGNGRWVFADGMSYFDGSFDKGEKKQGQLVMFDPDTKKQVQSYTGR